MAVQTSEPTKRPVTSGLVVGRPRASIAYTEARGEIGLSRRELADDLVVSHSVLDRWEAEPGTGRIEKPVPLALLFADGVPDALVVAIVSRALGRIGKSSNVAAAQALGARVKRDGIPERDYDAMLALYNQLHDALFRGSR